MTTTGWRGRAGYRAKPTGPSAQDLGDELQLEWRLGRESNEHENGDNSDDDDDDDESSTVRRTLSARRRV